MTNIAWPGDLPPGGLSPGDLPIGKRKTRKIFLVTRAGRLVVPDSLPPGTPLEDGLDFDRRIEEDFGPLIQTGLFTASDPGGGEVFSVLLLPDETPLYADYRVEPLRALIHDFAYNRLLRMYHLAQWRAESRYCGSCGQPNTDAPNGEYARLCPRCGRKEFPRISPAVLVLIKNEKDEALLAHNRNFKNNVYSLIAGFMEAGENLENTVRREVREEVGLEVEGITFITSQSWPFPNSLMAGFTAVCRGGAIRCDNDEITDARWFSRGNLPDIPGQGSVSRFIIDQWINSPGKS